MIDDKIIDQKRQIELTFHQITPEIQQTILKTTASNQDRERERHIGV
jgi:hypothetical protein